MRQDELVPEYETRLTENAMLPAYNSLVLAKPDSVIDQDQDEMGHDLGTHFPRAIAFSKESSSHPVDLAKQDPVKLQGQFGDNIKTSRAAFTRES